MDEVRETVKDFASQKIDNCERCWLERYNVQPRAVFVDRKHRARHTDVNDIPLL